MKNTRIGFVAVLAVFFLFICFVGSSVLIILSGSGVQHSSENSAQISFSNHIVFSYVSEKLRQSDGCGSIYAGDFGGQNALFIESKIENTIYTDIIYSYDNSLFELYCKKGALLSPQDGRRLIDSGNVFFSEPEPGVILIEGIDMNGELHKLHIYLKSGRSL